MFSLKFDSSVGCVLVPTPRTLRALCALLLILSLWVDSALGVDTRVRIELPGGAVAEPRVYFTTKPFYTYAMEQSTDLTDWNDLGGTWYGDGMEAYAGIDFNTERMFYRVRETIGSFMTLPVEGQGIVRTDGVRFAFNMNGFTTATLPAKIRIYQRPWNTGAPWTQIGQLTEFAMIRGEYTVRGGSVWVSPTDGEFEVKAEAVDAGGGIIQVNQRHILIGQNLPPVIAITGGPSATSPTALPAVFNIAVSDPDGDPIRRVEFYDNGVLMASDLEAPFGGVLLDFRGNPLKLLRGLHSITAKAYDSKLSSGQTVGAYLVNITGGNARSKVEVIASPLSVIQGQNFEVSCISSDPDGTSDIAYLESIDVDNETIGGYSPGAPFNILYFNSANLVLGTHVFRVVLIEHPDDPHDPEDLSYPVYFSVQIVNNSPTTFAQVLAGNIADETTLSLSNSRFTGLQEASVEYTAGLSSGLQIDEGIVMVTGFASYWNFGDDFYEDWGPVLVAPGDPILLTLLGGRHTTDAAILEFDAFCNHGQMELDFQFGSEEYDEYVGFFNDGFVVLIDGVVCSVIPDGTSIVSVNSINLNNNRILFLGDDEDTEAGILPENQGVQVEYDGTTIRLKLHAFVKAGTNHHVRISIADMDNSINADYSYDSAIFIKKSSLRTINPQP
jgi:hypothetical protein